MRKILGKTVNKFQFYKMEYWSGSISNHTLKRHERTNGFIWLEGGCRIRIQKGKFYIMNQDGKLTGLILKSTIAYRKIKRMIAVWFKTYRKLNFLFEDISYRRLSVGISLGKFEEKRNRKNFFQNLGNALNPTP